jgi:hypothetical protein
MHAGPGAARPNLAVAARAFQQRRGGRVGHARARVVPRDERKSRQQRAPGLLRMLQGSERASGVAICTPSGAISERTSSSWHRTGCPRHLIDRSRQS